MGRTWRSATGLHEDEGARLSRARVQTGAGGWRPLELVEDAGLAAHERNRPGVEQALRVLESGEANALVAAKRERLSRALGELAALLARAQQQGWALVALDCAVQTTTAAAEASVLATFAHCERRSISERTRAALARKRAQGGRRWYPATVRYTLNRTR